MRLGDVYKHKINNNIIQVDSFATHMNNYKDQGLIVVFTNIEKHNDCESGSNPSNNGYGIYEETESEYELLINCEDLDNYSGWDEILNLV